MATKSVSPSISETAFDCPHYGAYTTQTWHNLHSVIRSDSDRTPHLADKEFLEKVRAAEGLPAEVKASYLTAVEKQLAGLICLYDEEKYTSAFPVYNLHLGECFNCHEFSVWVRDKLLFPESRQGPPANVDMPQSVKTDYEEASKILTLSPRGAAALLRLAIQKLCAELGEKGENINDDIKSLVARGLSPQIQMALDAVRVIGNEAVHPGTLDLKDDSGTAGKLFLMVNIIDEQMISNPKHVTELFAKIPEEKKKAIEQRDKK